MTVSLGTGLSCLADHCAADQMASEVVRKYPSDTALDSPVGHAAGTARPQAGDRLLTMSIPGRSSSAAMLVRAGFVAVWCWSMSPVFALFWHAAGPRPLWNGSDERLINYCSADILRYLWKTVLYS
jgi:hypothetical protein